MKETGISARLLFSNGDQDTIELCQCFLEESGFVVSSKSKRGINFYGSVKLFEEAFQAELSLEGNPHFVSELKFPENIAKIIRGIYFPTKTLMF